MPRRAHTADADAINGLSPPFRMGTILAAPLPGNFNTTEGELWYLEPFESKPESPAAEQAHEAVGRGLQPAALPYSTRIMAGSSAAAV